MSKFETPVLYHPVSAFVLYMRNGDAGEESGKAYVEHFGIDSNGNPVNAHPLTVREAQRLSKLLQNSNENLRNSFLVPEGLMPANVLYTSTEDNGLVIWHTKAAKRKMYFTKSLAIPNAKVSVPALLWVATKEELRLFALKTNQRPKLETPLFHAPFFNMYEVGAVCMGTVDVQIKRSLSLEQFMQQWEEYFFNSYFSHLINEHNPVKGSCFSLWKRLATEGGSFPTEILKPHFIKLNSLLP